MNGLAAPNHREVLSLISELTRAVRCCQQEEAFCENVTFSQFLILDMVGKKGRLRLSDLHEVLAVEKSTTTRLVDPLAKRGLVVRERSDRDSRAVNLKLTKEGESVLGRVWQCLSSSLRAIERQVPEDRREDVYAAVRVFTEAVKNACKAGCCNR